MIQECCNAVRNGTSKHTDCQISCPNLPDTKRRVPSRLNQHSVASGKMQHDMPLKRDRSMVCSKSINPVSCMHIASCTFFVSGFHKTMLNQVIRVHAENCQRRGQPKDVSKRTDHAAAQKFAICANKSTARITMDVASTLCT